jgi:phosphatidate cytidylyltransferase|tara:strand:- start:20692 stop:21330 length:639 start_codon:yes stop_codon:yes gene_type:complete
MLKREFTGLIIAFFSLAALFYTNSYFFYFLFSCILMTAAYELSFLIKKPYFPSFITLILIFTSILLMPIYELSRSLMLFAISISVFTDSACYYFGKNFGSIKIFPKTSPNKTLEGLIFGSVFTFLLLFFIVYSQIFEIYLRGLPKGNGPLTTLLLLSIFASILGDFIESRLKRIADVKDSGNIFPGHGGMLDRLDSHLLVLPLFFIILGLLK